MGGRRGLGAERRRVGGGRGGVGDPGPRHLAQPALVHLAPGDGVRAQPVGRKGAALHAVARERVLGDLGAADGPVTVAATDEPPSATPSAMQATIIDGVTRLASARIPTPSSLPDAVASRTGTQSRARRPGGRPRGGARDGGRRTRARRAGRSARARARPGRSAERLGEVPGLAPAIASASSPSAADSTARPARSSTITIRRRSSCESSTTSTRGPAVTCAAFPSPPILHQQGLPPGS